MHIKDRTFVISGGSSGLGLATVQELHSQGAYIAILDYNSETLNAVSRDLVSQRVLFCKADLSSPTSTKAGVEKVLAWVQKTGKPIGGIIPAAGIGTPGQLINRKGETLPLESVEKVLNVNVRGVFDLIRLLLPSMISNTPTAPDGERGVIIMVSSAAAFDGQPGQLAYAASKGAIRSSTLVLARDLAQYGIRCCTIAPGYFESAMTRRASDRVRKSLEKVFEFPRRAGRAEEFAAMARHVVENPMLNGETIRLDGATRMGSKM